MEQRTTDIVSGYVRLNYDKSFVSDIVEIIYQFYVIITSNILNYQEQIAFVDLLFNRLKQEKGNQNMTFIHTELLFRASDNEYDCGKFYNAVGDKGATITIIHNEHGHKFGGYVSESWEKNIDGCDHHSAWSETAFLFVISPTIKCFEKTWEYEDLESISQIPGWGPIFGDIDIMVRNFGDVNDRRIETWGDPEVFKYSSRKLFGVKARKRSSVIDFETFAIKIVQ